MNYIAQLQQENRQQAETIKEMQEEINTLLVYYTSAKFQGFTNDFAHVSTDLVPKLYTLRNMAYIHLKKENLVK